MSTRAALVVVLLAAALAARTACAADAMAVQDLGDGKYRIGAIQLDKAARSFEVPGRVIMQEAIDAPMEFLAVSKGAMKSYEAVLELDTTAVAFNTACILIGLGGQHATIPRYHFDPEAVRGDPVALTVLLKRAEDTRALPLSDLILVDGKHALPDWVYTGSYFAGNGKYQAEVFGTLIGFVHDPDSIIHHRTGLGLGDYGAVVVNPEIELKPREEIVVRVSAKAEQ